MNKKTSDVGRTMVETLGVLAIMGVLTILALMGYRIAMDKHATNALLAELSSMATTTSIRLSVPHNTEKFKITGNLRYPFVAALDTDYSFTITVSEIPKRICSSMVAMNWNLPYEIKVNNSPDGVCDLKENTMSFSFYNSIQDGRPPEFKIEPPSDTSGDDDPPPSPPFPPTPPTPPSEDPCNPCREGCLACVEDNYRCWEDGCECTNGATNPPECTQLTDDDASSEDTASSSEPTCSVDTVPITQCNGEVYNCCPATETCKSLDCCASNTDCTYMWEVCEAGVCTCPVGYFRNSNGNCTNCANSSKKETTEIECSKCDITDFKREMTKDGYCQLVKNKCPAGTYSGHTKEGEICLGCDAPEALSITAEKCAECANRSMQGGYCVLTTCPPEHFRDPDGGCVPCNAVGSYDGTSESECNQCNSTASPRVFGYNKGIARCLLCAAGELATTESSTTICRPCSYYSIVSTSSTECAKCSDRSYVNNKCYPGCNDDSFRNSAGNCISCSQIIWSGSQNTWKPLSTAECDKCASNRWMRGEYCVPHCPTGYFQNTNGNCTDCGLMSSKATSQDECQKCPSFYGRTYSGGKCNLTSCPAGGFRCSTPENTGNNSTCRLCDDTGSYIATASECAKCPGREMRDGYCVLKSGF